MFSRSKGSLLNNSESLRGHHLLSNLLLFITLVDLQNILYEYIVLTLILDAHLHILDGHATYIFIRVCENKVRTSPIVTVIANRTLNYSEVWRESSLSLFDLKAYLVIKE